MNTQLNHPNTRTDLAIERVSFLKEADISGIEQKKQERNGVTVTEISVTDQIAAEHLQKPMGRYLTLEPTKFSQIPLDFEEEVTALSWAIASFLPENVAAKDAAILVVGLGNQQITPDALGPRTVRYTMATRHLSALREQGLPLGASVCAIAPGVLGQTGMETAEVIKSLCDTLSPKAVLVIDALAAGEASRLGRTVQLSDTGISPGSGVLNKRKELSEQTLGTKVISIGVPTVIDFHSENQGMMMVTPREIDLIIEHAAKLIGFSVNKALHSELSVSDIASLVA